MNKRFIIKFFKYMSIFLVVNFIVSVAFVFFMFYTLVVNLYDGMNDISSEDLELYNITDQPNERIKNLAKKQNASLYVTKKNGDISYPKHLKSKNIKPIILKNINNANSIESDRGIYLVYIYDNKTKNYAIRNSDDIDANQLLDSIKTQDYNRFNYNVSDGLLTFTKNSNFRQDSSSIEAGERASMSFIKITCIFILVNIILVALTAFFISKRLTKPLSYYIDWIGNLSQGKLHQPTSKRKIKKKRKTYPELDTSLTQLNQQMLSNKIYHNQIDYYKSKWISQISHDLKSPLTTIYGYSKLIQTDESSQSYVQLIVEKSLFMSKLIDSLNTTFDAETRQMKQDKEHFPIKSTVDHITSIIGYEAISLTFNLNGKDEFYGNKLYFERLLINLINNSIEHNNENPAIDITFTLEDINLVIDYKDNGQGIAKNNIEQLIKQSYTSKLNKEQHGVGLSIIQDAVNYHNGHIELIPISKGVHFHIVLISEEDPQ